jgi:hypothetical protein
LQCSVKVGFAVFAHKPQRGQKEGLAVEAVELKPAVEVGPAAWLPGTHSGKVLPDQRNASAPAAARLVWGDNWPRQEEDSTVEDRDLHASA